MKGKQYLELLLDLLVDMSNHCKYKDVPIEGKSKCIDCELQWDFNVMDYGCLLVNIIENNEFIDNLTSVCGYHNVEYNDRLNNVASIFDTGYEEEI